MNAPLPISEIHALGSLEQFAECCEIQVWFCVNGWASLPDAVDNSQRLAELWLLVDEYGQDTVQAFMADAFAPREAVEQIDLPADYALQIVRRWEMADPRDRWQHTGELPSSPERAPITAARPSRVPSSTVDAFKYVVSLGDPERLARWLRDHSDVAAALLKGVAEC
jgi:hypothetical protein